MTKEQVATELVANDRQDGGEEFVSATVKVDIRQLPHGEGLALPAYQSADAAGLDLLAAVPADTPLILPPGKYAMVPTGLTIALPSGYEAQVRPRSGLAAKHGVTVLNSPGTVDADYRGEINVLLINHGEAPFPIRRGERIAQMVIAPVVQASSCPSHRCRQPTAAAAVSARPGADKELYQKYGIGPQTRFRLPASFFHSQFCVHGLDSYRSTPEGDTLDPIRARRG